MGWDGVDDRLNEKYDFFLSLSLPGRKDALSMVATVKIVFLPSARKGKNLLPIGASFPFNA